MPLSKTTTDHNEIQRWAEDRGGKPVCIRRTGSENDAGVLRINFPGYSKDNSLQAISWEEFFVKFDQTGLAMVYQEKTAAGEKSNFNKLVKRETAERKAQGGGSRSSTRTSADKPQATRTRAASTAKKPATSRGSKVTTGKK
jgi:hypothetical protein